MSEENEENNLDSSEQEPENFKIVSDGVVTDSYEDMAVELEKQDESELDIPDEADTDDDNEESSDEKSDEESEEENSDDDESLEEENSEEESGDEESDEDSDADVEDEEEESESTASEEDSDKDEPDSSVNTEEVATPVPQAKKLPVDPVLNKNAEIEKKIFGDADKYLQEASANFSEKKCSINMDDLNILLTFETGQQSITFRELQTLKPGFIFQGNNPVDVPVDVKANGKTIGRGQLIDVGGRIGVQIMELF